MSGDGVVAAAAPGVTAQDAPDGKVEASDGTVLAEGFDGVLAAGGGIAAGGGCEGGDEVLVEVYGDEEELDYNGADGVHSVVWIWCSICAMAAVTVAVVWWLGVLQMRAMSRWVGRSWRMGRWWR